MLKETDVIVPGILESSQWKVIGDSGDAILARVNDNNEFDPWMDEVRIGYGEECEGRRLRGQTRVHDGCNSQREALMCHIKGEVKSDGISV